MQDIYVGDTGKGFPLVLIHGFLGSSKMWEPQIEFLKKALIEKNKNIVVFWSRGGYTPGFQILKNLMRLIFGRILPKPGNSQKRDCVR